MRQESLKSVTLELLSREQRDAMDSLGATCDTLGWAYFRTGDLAAEMGNAQTIEVIYTILHQ